MTHTPHFVLGLDLDGTCADFYGRMRQIAAVWTEQPLDELPLEAEWSMQNWGIGEGGYEEFHRYAVTEHQLFETMAPLPGSPEAIARLVAEGIRLRIITHRLILPSLHETTVLQTVRWLEQYRIPYWDLCFMREKDDVNADLYVEDSVINITRLIEKRADVVIMNNGTNRETFFAADRADDWQGAEKIIRAKYYGWLDAVGLEHPPAHGRPPSWFVEGNSPQPRSSH